MNKGLDNGVSCAVRWGVTMRNYDKRVKQTRILLADYIIIKGFAQRAGLSMAEALHKLLARQFLEAKPITQPVTQPAYRVPVTQVALRYASQPAIATNGSKIAAIGIKPKGARYDD
ncbi:hypothetical protein ES705_25494 [subsurface metagenome]